MGFPVLLAPFRRLGSVCRENHRFRDTEGRGLKQWDMHDFQVQNLLRAPGLRLELDPVDVEGHGSRGVSIAGKHLLSRKWGYRPIGVVR